MGLCGHYMRDFKFLHLLVPTILEVDVLAKKDILHDAHKLVTSGMVITSNKSFSSHSLFP